jgi:hypothetical protein
LTSTHDLETAVAVPEGMKYCPPDVDPATVPLDGWESYRKRDGGFRRDFADLDERMDRSLWRQIIVFRRYSCPAMSLR